VEVGYEDGPYVFRRLADLLEVSQRGGGTVEEVAVVEEEGTPVALRREGVAGAQEAKLQGLLVGPGHLEAASPREDNQYRRTPYATRLLWALKESAASAKAPHPR